MPLDGCCLLGALYVAMTHPAMTFMMTCYDYKIELETVVGWHGVELTRAFRVSCGQCYVRREPRL